MNAGLGFLLALLACTLSGSFGLPMKRTTRWEWENTWLVWGLFALIIVPWTVALTTVPHLTTAYQNAGRSALITTFAFGATWGMGSVLFGMSMARIGMSLVFAIAVGLDAALGSILPMALKPSVFGTIKGAVIVVGVVAVVVGVIVCAVAGGRKEAYLAKAEGKAASEVTNRGVIVQGVMMAIVSGLFNPALNFAFVFGDRIRSEAVIAGASAVSGSDAIWAIALGGGAVANFAFCGLLLTRNRTWTRFRAARTASHWPLAALMGVLWCGAIVSYGRGAAMMGPLGSSIGWPLMEGGSILVSNLWGIATGEWRNSGLLARRTMLAGVIVMMVAMTIIGYGNSLPG